MVEAEVAMYLVLVILNNHSNNNNIPNNNSALMPPSSPQLSLTNEFVALINELYCMNWKETVAGDEIVAIVMGVLMT